MVPPQFWGQIRIRWPQPHIAVSFSESDEVNKLPFSPLPKKGPLIRAILQVHWLIASRICVKRATHYSQTTTKPVWNENFTEKNCKFAKLNENHATHYSSIVKSFTPESNFLRKIPFEFVMETAHLAKQDEHLLHTIRGVYRFRGFIRVS